MHKAKVTTAIKETYRKNDFVYLNMENIKKYITIDSEIQNGQPVFSGTRVPVETLFWHLEKGISIDEFLEDFPSVTKEQAIGVIGIAHKILTSGNIDKIYETVA